MAASKKKKIEQCEQNHDKVFFVTKNDQRLERKYEKSGQRCNYKG